MWNFKYKIDYKIVNQESDKATLSIFFPSTLRRNRGDTRKVLSIIVNFLTDQS